MGSEPQAAALDPIQQSRADMLIRQTESALEVHVHHTGRLENLVEKLRGPEAPRPTPDVPEREAGQLGYLADVSARFNMVNSRVEELLSELEQLI